MGGGGVAGLGMGAQQGLLPGFSENFVYLVRHTPKNN